MFVSAEYVKRSTVRMTYLYFARLIYILGITEPVHCKGGRVKKNILKRLRAPPKFVYVSTDKKGGEANTEYTDI